MSKLRPLARFAAALALVSLAPAHALSAQDVKGTSERELLAAFRQSFDSKDEASRARAVNTLGNSSRQLADMGVGKRIAQALVRGLEDRDLDVAAAAVSQLCYGRDVDTVIVALDAFLRAQYREIEKRAESTDDASREFVGRATVLFGNACYAFMNYKDERTAATLVALLENLPADTKKSDAGSRLVGALAAATLEQGTEPAVATAVEKTKTFSGAAQTAGGQALHAALTEFATKHEWTPPDWNETYSQAWFSWLEANRNKLPKKLGRLAAPPMNEPSHAQNGMPGKS